MHTTEILDTSWGHIEIVLDRQTVIHCKLPYLAETPATPFQASPPAASSPSLVFAHALLTSQQAQRPAFEFKTGTPFQQAVWQAIAQIPYGTTSTYGELAQQIGSPQAARAVGSACGKNPIPLFVPCHRVLAASGPGGFSCGLPWKLLLLQQELMRTHS